MPRALITTVPFGVTNRLPFELLENAGIEYLVNPLNRKLTEQDLVSLVERLRRADCRYRADHGPSDGERTAAQAHLASRHRSRRRRLAAAKRRGIEVAYTPDAPAPAVAELTIGLILSLLRSVHIANQRLHPGTWQRILGRRLAEVTVGIIGVGRVGTRVLRRTKAFGTPRILVNDIMPNLDLNREFKLEWLTKDEIYTQADVISLHLPLTPLTKDLIRRDHLLAMKPDALIVNTSRGGIINERDLHEVMKTGHLGGAAIDVFEEEPYAGPLREIDRCILTAHMGSMSVDCRVRMEIEATEEVVRFAAGKPLDHPVPQSEYDVQGRSL